jgi:hypothetical protein
MIICMRLQRLHVGMQVQGAARRVNAMLQTRLTQSSHFERCCFVGIAVKPAASLDH